MSFKALIKELRSKKIWLWVLALLPFALCISIPIAIASGNGLRCIICRVTAAITKNPLTKLCK